jgi:hypothetical protein
MTMETSRWKPPGIPESPDALQLSMPTEIAGFIPRKLTMKVRKEGKTNTTGRKKLGVFH